MCSITSDSNESFFCADNKSGRWKAGGGFEGDAGREGRPGRARYLLHGDDVADVLVRGELRLVRHGRLLLRLLESSPSTETGRQFGEEAHGNCNCRSAGRGLAGPRPKAQVPMWDSPRPKVARWDSPDAADCWKY